MTSGATVASMYVDCGVASVAAATVSIPAHEQSISQTPLKQYLKTRQRKCMFAVVIVTVLGMSAYVMSKLIMGSMYLGYCPTEPFIPIYMTVSAILLIVFAIIITCIIKRQRSEDNDQMSPVHLIAFMYFFIQFILQMTGSMRVIRARHGVSDLIPRETVLGEVGCDDVFLSYSFGVIIFEFVLFGIFLSIAAISLCEVICAECCLAHTHTKSHEILRNDTKISTDKSNFTCKSSFF